MRAELSPSNRHQAAFEGVRGLPCCEIPDMRGAVNARGEQKAAIGTECGRLNNRRVFHRQIGLPGTSPLPNADRLVVAYRKDPLPVRAERRESYRACMLERRSHWSPTGSIPNPDCPIRACCQDKATLGAEGNVHNRPLVPERWADRHTRSRIPHLGSAVVTRCDQPAAIRTEAGAPNAPSMANHHNVLAGDRITNTCHTIAAS